MADARSQAIDLMIRFADRTGLTSDAPPRRYLWTDAFAVCNFLGLARATGEGEYAELALRLVDRVHEELARYRAGDARAGWLSGLPDREARAHPTRGGLRIGKPLPERAATEPLDPAVEWDRDGQYFHYLTKWMHALDQATRTTGEARFNVWARELADRAHHAFVYGPSGARRMVWKLSVDLSRPLVPSMGQHDALDGFVTCKELDATRASLAIVAGPSLTAAEADFARMIDRGRLATTDPLGLGGLLVDAALLAQLDATNELTPCLLDAAIRGVHHYMTEPTWVAPAHERLAFRELGLVLGLAAVSVLDQDLTSRLDSAGQDRLAKLRECSALGKEIESFWLRSDHRRDPSWVDHLDINDVMLAATLEPRGFLDITH